MWTKVFDEVHEWYAKPFRGDGTVAHWFAFIGLVLIAAWIWRSVIVEIQNAID